MTHSQISNRQTAHRQTNTPRIAALQLTALRRTLLHKIDQTLAAMTRPPPDGDPLMRAAGRRCNDLIALWRLCGHAACRRGQSCHGLPEACLSRRLALLPRQARAQALAILKKRRAALQAGAAPPVPPPQRVPTSMRLL